jgi:SulP family sulfate permease
MKLPAGICLSAPQITGWSAVGASRTSALTWSMMPSLISALMVVVVVSLTSLIAKITSIEVTRGASGELDCELRSHGIASLIAAPFGGLGTSVQPATSMLLEHSGSATRTSGVVTALILGLVAIANLRLPSAVPINVIGALVFYLGLNFITETLWRLFRQQAWLDLLLAVVIMAVCLRLGYLVGVLIGLLCSCAIFAINYARIGVLRRQATRADFSSYVEHSPEASKYLRENGHAIRLYWLSGYLFFGSSEGVFERIRRDIGAPSKQGQIYVIIDFAMISGVDSSALFSISKLRNLSEKYNTTLVFSALLPEIRLRLENRGLLGEKNRHRAFTDVNSALTWCEDQLLAGATRIDDGGGVSSFHLWLQQQLGSNANAAEFAEYLEHKDIPNSQVLYRRGEPADTIDFVATGTLAIEIDVDGKIVRLRRMTTHTLVGEMGFFRKTTRSATVSAEGPVTLFTLSRTSFERLRGERPQLASAFDDFVIRVLADRIDFSNRVVATLNYSQ